MTLSIHSNKFEAEANKDRIEDVWLRHGVDHPVLIDRDHQIWHAYTVRAWPTLIFIRPDGTIAHALAGEQRLETLETLVQELLSEADTAKTRGKRYHVSRPTRAPSLGLRYPTSVTATAAGLAVSDAGHHRVVLTDGGGRHTRTIGCGEPGLVDGAFDRARFHRPGGLLYDGHSLLVADTGNHAVRSIDLESFEVSTLAGTGVLGRDVPQELTPAREVALRSPTDLAFKDGIVFIAMAGAHQIWAYLPEQRAIVVFAGSGREAIDDGALHDATFAQPTGLTADGDALYVVDSEASALRRIDTVSARVSTLLGHGLFEFGDRDGHFEDARLQHPEAIAFGPHGLLVADTYNHKIKAVRTEPPEATTWFSATDADSLTAPTGLHQLDGGQVLVADTDAHRVVVISADGTRVKPLPVFEIAEPGGGPR